MAVIKFNSGTMRIGNTLYLRIPPTLVENLNIDGNNSAVITMPGPNKIIAEFEKPGETDDQPNSSQTDS